MSLDTSLQIATRPYYRKAGVGSALIPRERRRGGRNIVSLTGLLKRTH